MPLRNTTLLLALLAVLIAVPAISSCQAVASYLLYQWIQDEFDDDDRDEPIIRRILIDREEVHVGDSVLLEAEAEDKQDSQSDLEYYWVASAGTILEPTSRITVYVAPDEPGEVTISLVVRDTDDYEDSASVQITVLE